MALGALHLLAVGGHPIARAGLREVLPIAAADVVRRARLGVAVEAGDQRPDIETGVVAAGAAPDEVVAVPAVRIEYLEGEPDKMTQAELDVLQSRDLLGQVRLSCQAVCDHDMSVRPLMTVTSTGLDGPGKKPEPTITPEPGWIDKPA